jgi:preprotein translocase subunit SecD
MLINIYSVYNKSHSNEMKGCLMNKIMSAKGGSQPKADQPLAGAKTSGGKKLLLAASVTLLVAVGCSPNKSLKPVDSEALNNRVYIERSKLEIKTESSSDQWASTSITQDRIQKVEVIPLQDNVFGVNVTLDEEGRGLFKKVTSENIGKRLAVFIDGVIISAPTVAEAINDGSFIISGNFTEAEANNFKEKLQGYK